MRLAALLMLAVLPSGAATVTLQHPDGTPVARGEVCWFRAGDAENPFKRWLASQDVKCAAADAPVTFPPGLWNVYGRAAGAISSSVLVSDESAPQSLTLVLRPAATVRSPKNSVSYAPRLASAWPGSVVPAGEDLLLFVIEKASPIAVIPVPALEPGTEREIDAAPAPPAIIGWLQIPEPDRKTVAAARGVSPPSVGVGSRGSDVLPPLDLVNGAFVRIRGVGAGDAELVVEGRGYIPYRRRVRVESSPITVVTDPLLVRPAGTLVVHWSTNGDVVALDRSLGACERAEPQRHTVAISACPPPRQGEPLDPASCSVVREESIDLTRDFGEIIAEDVAPGNYRVEMRIGKLPPVISGGSVGASQVRHISVSANYMQVHGSISVGGEPLREDVEIRFPGGYGFKPKDSDEYAAALLMPLFGPDTQIVVEACDGTPRTVVVTEQSIRRNARVDIDVPANELTVRVTDTFTREALSGATVRYTLMSKLNPPPRPILSRTFKTSSEGLVVIPHVPQREIRLLVSHSGYQKQNVQPFSIGSSETREVDVPLLPLRGTQGTIHASRPFDSGMVFWFARDGRETERADLNPDGTFVFANEHGPDETMAIASLSHPLLAVRAPGAAFRFPDVASRAVIVTVDRGDARDTRHVGVMLGGVRVPQPALQYHQSLRNQQALIRGAGPLELRDLADIGPLEVLLGPLNGEVASRALAMDFFALPQFASSPRQTVPPGAGAVVFTPK